jgi:threonylcarbamoyladenosine tRNA methylthiotransferase MtaB
MVGFPGEKQDDFSKTLDMIKQTGFLKVHIFPFSPREETPAFSFPGRLPEKTKKERFSMTKEISERVAMEIKEKFSGSTFDVLVEERKDAYWFGHTKNYLPVIFKSQENLHNTIVALKICGPVRTGNLQGYLLAE